MLAQALAALMLQSHAMASMLQSKQTIMMPKSKLKLQDSQLASMMVQKMVLALATLTTNRIYQIEAHPFKEIMG